MKHKILNGRSAIITGSSQGLGYAIAEEFLSVGANILICSRNEDQLKKAYNKLLKIKSPEQKLIKINGDVSKFDDVKSIIEYGIKELSKIEILVNNAGVYGPKGNIEENNLEKWKDAFNINLFGSVYPSVLLINHFKENNYGKIIQISGGGATNPLPYLSSYAASKAAVVRLMETISEETKFSKIDINSIAPGALNTRMLDEIIEAGPKIVGKNFYEKMTKIKNEGGTDLKIGAKLAVFLASNSSDGITGKLISAVWDNWEDFPSNKDKIMESDIYTIRRIAGRDRNMEWADK